MVTLLAPMVTMPCEFTLPGAPQGPISESRIVTLRTPLTTMHEPLLVLTCTFSITWPSLAMICPLTALPAIVTGVGTGPGEMLFGALAAAARESVSEQRTARGATGSGCTHTNRYPVPATEPVLPLSLGRPADR